MAFPCSSPSSPLPSYDPFNELAPPPFPSFDAGNSITVVEDYPPYTQPLDQPEPPSYPSFDAGNYLEDYHPSDQPLEDFAPPPYPSLEGDDAGQSFLELEESHFLGYGCVDAGDFLASFDGGDWMTSLPPGYRFRPTDEELVVDYLQREILDASSALRGFITHADIYDYEPHHLSGLVEQDYGDGKMYFYTRIKKIGKSKTDRSIKSKKGFWKPTQAPKPIRDRSEDTIGYKTSLAYFEDNKKTQWLMKEYKLHSHTSHHSSQDLVLAVVYFYRRKSRDDDY